MFPYVCLATLPLFYSVDWPKRLQNKLKQMMPKCSSSQKDGNDTLNKLQTSENCIYHPDDILKLKSDKNSKKLQTTTNWKHKLVVSLLLTHCSLQFFLPYSHFITKGYNNWTNGLYGYSWDMMVHAWDTILVVVKVVDNEHTVDHFLDPAAWTLNDRWTKHGDMMYQYAQCLRTNLIDEMKKLDKKQMNNPKNYLTSENISIYIDVWCSLNGRFQQRMFNPNYDLLQVEWSPFKPIEWLMPLLTEFSGWRNQLNDIQKHVYSWSNYSDVIFVADFPGLYLENYIAPDLSNVSLTVLEGEVFFEMDNHRELKSIGEKLYKGMSLPVPPGIFHKVHTISATPACYMYTYINQTKMLSDLTSQDHVKSEIFYPMKSPFPLIEDLNTRLDNMKQMFLIITNSIANILFDVPMIRRIKMYE